MPSLSGNELNILITAENTAGPELAAVGAEVEALEKKSSSLGSSFKSVGSNLSSLGSTLSVAVTAPLIGLGLAAVKMGTDFEKNMTLIQTQAGASAQEVKNLTGQVLELAKHSAQGPTQLAEGLYHLESLGLRGAAAMTALATSSKMAALGNANLEETTSALGAALVTGIKGTENLDKAAGTLDATIGNGNMRMGELVAALSSGILPAAKNFGLSLTDVGAALATLTDNGMRADEAATRLRMTFSLIAAPTHKAQGALAEIGLGADELAKKMRYGGLPDAIDLLRSKLEHSGKSATEQARVLSDAFGGGRSSAAIMTLVEQSDRLRTKFVAIGEQSGTFGEKVAATQETAAYKFNAAWSKIQASLVELSTTILPVVTPLISKLADGISAVATWFEKLSPTQKEWTLGMAALLLVLGPILVVFGAIATAIGAIVALGAPVLAVIAVIVGLAVAAITILANWKTVSTFFTKFWKDVKDMAMDAIKSIIDGITWLGTHWFQVLGFMYGFWATLPIKMFFVMVEGFAMITRFIMSINWWNVLIGIVVAIANVGTAIYNSVAGAFHMIMNLNWGGIAGNVGRGIGNAVIDMIQGALNGAMSGIPGMPHIRLPHFASGVQNFKGGMAVVGENGPEIVSLPQGSNVYPNGTGPSGGGQTVNIFGDINLDGADAVTEWTKRVLGRDTFLQSKGLAGASY
jgi:TP901 family phage tail tape measure protein